MFSRSALLALFLMCIHGLAQAAGGLDIYFVRHAQTVSNAKGVNNTKNSSTFSYDGVVQIDMLTEALGKYRFDAILVSPTERTLYTILPYLLETGKKAEVWPEITECCWQRDRGDVEGGQLIQDKDIQLPSEIASQFTFRDRNSARAYGNHSYADGIAQVRRGAELIRQLYGNSGKTLLIVAHYHSGQVLLGELLGVERETLPGLENARITHLKQGADGKFSLQSVNVAPQ